MSEYVLKSSEKDTIFRFGYLHIPDKENFFLFIITIYLHIKAMSSNLKT